VSAVAGCCWLDDRPANADDLRASTAARHRAREPFRIHCAGPVALAYAADIPDDRQPFHDASTRTTLIVDGRIDNLDDLADALGTVDRSAPSVVLAAWRRWGLEAGSHLLGDFVVIVSDEAARRVVCIRDPMGQRPLFYGTGPRGVVFGSEVQQIVRHLGMATGLDKAINLGMIGEYLTGEPETTSETLWRGVHRLPPAHTLEITARGATVRRYWDFDPAARVSFARAEEYADHFREVFTRAVACRVRDADRAGVFLSGGIDSSSVAGVAQAIGAASGRAPIHAFTLAFPGRPCDETVYSQAVAGMWRLPATCIDAVPPTREELARLAARYLDVPAHPNSLAADPLRARARSTGVPVVLTGVGGDDFFTGDPSSPSDLLHEGRVVAWGRAMVSPMLSPRARTLLRPVFGARRPRRPWIQPAFAARIALDDRLRRREALAFPTHEQQQSHRAAISLIHILADEMEDRAAHAAGIAQRHPFYDRRVAELGLALPPSQRSEGAAIKVVVRRALGGYLPPLVASRATLADKAEFSPTYVEALEALGPHAFATLRSEDAGWVDGRVIRRMYEDMIQLYSRSDGAYIALSGQLWAVAALELWLEAASAESTAANRARSWT
jgi:asparagine synthase (glutamine-hydrolysing)